MAAAEALAPEHDDAAATHAQPPATPSQTRENVGIAVAVWTPAPDDEELVDQAFEAARSFAASGGSLLVLPELFCFSEGSLDDPLEAAEVFVPVVRALCEACAGSGLHIATSLVEARDATPVHVGVLLSAAGIVARQPQLEATERYPWPPLGERQGAWQMPYGRLSLLVGDDALHPERVRAAVERADIVACVANARGSAADWGEVPEVLRAALAAGVCVVAAWGGENGGGLMTGVAVAPGGGTTAATASGDDAPDETPSSLVRAASEGGLTQAILRPGPRPDATEAVEPPAAEPPTAPGDAEAPAVSPARSTENSAAADAATENIAADDAATENIAADDAATENIAADDAAAENAAGSGAAASGVAPTPGSADHEATPEDQQPVNEPAEATQSSVEGETR